MKPPKINFSTNFLEPSWVATSQLSSLRISHTITSDCRYISDVCFVRSAIRIDMAFIIISELSTAGLKSECEIEPILIETAHALYCYWAISLVLRVGRRTRLYYRMASIFLRRISSLIEDLDCTDKLAFQLAIRSITTNG